MQPVFRFAPSPNGRLHLGHAYSALLNAKLARAMGGRMLLRIEDIDFTRRRNEFVDGIFEDLHWLELEWEEPVRYQLDHRRAYADALEKLKQKGFVYPCYATRKEIASYQASNMYAKNERTPDGQLHYPGLYKNISDEVILEKKALGEKPNWRLDMEKAVAWADMLKRKQAFAYNVFDGDKPDVLKSVPCNPELWGDVILARRDIGTSYHMAVVVDDALQGVTHVVRGQDLEDQTSIHALLQTLLDLPQPVYFHHPLVKDETGNKLAKSRGSRSLKVLRDAGVSVEDIRHFLGF